MGGHSLLRKRERRDLDSPLRQPGEPHFSKFRVGHISKDDEKMGGLLGVGGEFYRGGQDLNFRLSLRSLGCGERAESNGEQKNGEPASIAR
jgi:hypothetical protein